MDFFFNAAYVKRVLKERGLQYIDLVNLMAENGYEVTESAVKKWFMKKPVPPSLKNMAGVAKALKLPMNSVILENQTVKTGVKPVPIVGYVSCGLPEQNSYDGDEVLYYPEELWSENLYSVVACGDSMSPEIDDGDFLTCDKSVNIVNGDLVHYTLFNDTAVKIYFKDNNGTIKLIPRNRNENFITVNITKDDKDLLANFNMAKVVRITKAGIDNRSARLKAVGII